MTSWAAAGAIPLSMHSHPTDTYSTRKENAGVGVCDADTSARRCGKRRPARTKQHSTETDAYKLNPPGRVHERHAPAFSRIVSSEPAGNSITSITSKMKPRRLCCDTNVARTLPGRSDTARKDGARRRGRTQRMHTDRHAAKARRGNNVTMRTERHSLYAAGENGVGWGKKATN
jgi:hypothetical protein